MLWRLWEIPPPDSCLYKSDHEEVANRLSGIETDRMKWVCPANLTDWQNGGGLEEYSDSAEVEDLEEEDRDEVHQSRYYFRQKDLVHRQLYLIMYCEYALLHRPDTPRPVTLPSWTMRVRIKRNYESSMLAAVSTAEWLKGSADQ